MSFAAVGAALLLTTSAAAQTPMDIEGSVDQAESALEREQGAMSGQPVDASFGTAGQSTEGGTNAAAVPSEGFFFEDDKPRSFWRSQSGRRIVHPVTAPTYNDDAYITTDLRGSYINHQIPGNATSTEGAARVYGGQLRYAVDERLQLMVYKLGYTDVHGASGEELGFDDFAVGVKYAVLQDWESQSHVSVGLGYEFGVGDEDTFGDDDELRLFGAYNKGFDRSHIGVAVNALFATGSEDDLGDSDRLSVHFHYDYELTEMISPLIELNYYKTLSDGNPVTPFNGLDLANFGGNEDEDALSIGLGGEVRMKNDIALRIAYESPLTDDVDLWGYRWTASAVWRF